MKDFDTKLMDKLNSIPQDEVPSDLSVSRMMGKLDQVIPQESKMRSMVIAPQSSNISSWFVRIAASISLLLMVGYLVYKVNEVEIVVGLRAHQSIILPDNSKVTLNSGSEISYNKVLWYFGRELHLQGEGFFEVTKGKKFEVISDQGTTQVLGTSFNVFARENQYKVACYTGKVRVSNNENEVILKSGDGVTYLNKRIHEFTFPLEKSNDWRNGEFYFENSPFFLVINELERQYDVRIAYPENFADIAYTGYFNNRNFDQALKLVCEPLELKFQVNANQIMLFPAIE